MLEISMHIRYCMLYEFQLENNASAASRHMCCTSLHEGAVADLTSPDWFKRFREGGMPLKDRLRFGCPLQSHIERIKLLTEDNPSLTTRELSAMLGCNQSTIDHHLHDIRKVNKL